jgi:hypothetical protein
MKPAVDQQEGRRTRFRLCPVYFSFDRSVSIPKDSVFTPKAKAKFLKVALLNRCRVGDQPGAAVSGVGVVAMGCFQIGVLLCF